MKEKKNDKTNQKQNKKKPEQKQINRINYKCTNDTN